MSTVREDYTAKIKLPLDALNACVDVLESRMQEAEVRSSYRAELSMLRDAFKHSLAYFKSQF